ncbi:hypothetical protein V5P93_004219 [Actinokineospora auranticolor]|uniref:Uncharacterized protein n=1 Tax=Actinokineospora auranticolor TaxID=155976 RepID=A0A2S6GIQ4_9PSEU|nr:hypothetical protein [Actinokineospora auranticolor]PPK65036.1 hypothetical protein CLV40_11679 [Actinokineospora auranticolor]
MANRRRVWVIGAAVATAVVVVAGVWLVRALVGYFRLPLDERDSQASVVSMFIGGASLVLGLVSLVVTLAQSRRAPAPTQTITASGGGIAQGVIGGDIVNHPAGPGREHR